MLILAGVSINAIVGDNGVLTRTQYASFLNEMAAVEEAVQLWKTGEVIESNGEETKAIPANGLCKANELTNTERLVGEVGYYRIWSMSETQPTTDILSDASTFNKAFESELIFYPAGVQDLYYLNNDALEIKGNKTYLIDASTGMIYSMTGIGLKGVRCYSSSMAKAVMNGESTMPLFAEAEVSGTGSDEKLAGNVSTEYLMDENGNYILDESGNKIKNPEYNSNGFQIIASPSSNNIFKLYNNGDLYAKGLKGAQLVTSKEDMQSISNSNWTTFSIPSEVGSYKKIIRGSNTCYVIDSNDDLWAWGNNSYNKLGLTAEQQKEYTGREPIKLNVDNKKVSKIWDVGTNLFVLTIDNVLYGMGRNKEYYSLGLGHNEEVLKFQKIDVKTPENIDYISSLGESRYGIYIVYKDKSILITGSSSKGCTGIGISGVYSKFVPILDGYVYNITDAGEIVKNTEYEYNSQLDIDGDIIKIISDTSAGMTILKKDKTLWHTGSIGQNLSYTGVKSNVLTKLPTEFGENVKDIYSLANGLIILKENGDIYANEGWEDRLGFGFIQKETVKLELPESLSSSGIKEIYTQGNGMYILDNSGKIYGAGSEAIFGLEEPFLGVKEITNAPQIKSFYNLNELLVENAREENTVNTLNLFLGEDNKLYTVNHSELTFRNNVLQSNWKLIASNCRKVALNEINIAYIDDNSDLYVAGNDARSLGLGIENKSIIYNFTKVTDSNIIGKAKEVCLGSNVIYVITNNEKLYASGLYSPYAVVSSSNDKLYPGWNVNEARYNFQEIPEVSSVKKVIAYNTDKILLSDEGLYYLGKNYNKNMPSTTELFNKWDVSAIIDVKNIKDFNVNWYMSTMISKTGEFYAKAEEHFEPDSITANFLSGNNFCNYSEKFKIGDEIKKIKSINSYSGSAEFALDEDGNLWAWGAKKYIGLGETSEAVSDPTIVLTNVKQIVCGNGWSIAVKEDGSVWGTGSNQYGILGRWVGVDRGESNSRYKTSYYWVECPELEI